MVEKRKGEGGEEWEIIESKEEGIMHMRIKENDWKEGGLNVVTIYNTKKSKMICGRIMEKWGNEQMVIGEDFNIRIGELRGKEEARGIKRRNRDKKIGNGGREFAEGMQEKDLEILNGRTEGDWKGEFTYVEARESTVIDFHLEIKICRKKLKALGQKRE